MNTVDPIRNPKKILAIKKLDNFHAERLQSGR